MAELLGGQPRTDWGAILAGAALATAIGLILTAFGLGIGLSVTSPYEGEGSTPALFAFGAGLWILLIQLLSFGAGGYVAARLRSRQGEGSEHETDVRDGLHGLLAWAVGVIAAGLISYLAIGGATGAATAGRANDPVGSAVEAADAEFDQAAAREQVDNPEAADESAIERRAEVVRKLSVIAAFITAASLLVGGVAAFFAAGVGGKHRDQNTQVKFFTLRRPKRRAAPVEVTTTRVP
jgi:hypothetical protein